MGGGARYGLSVTAVHGALVELRPIEEADADALRAIHAAPEVTEWWGRMDESFPFGDDPDATRFAILVDGAIAGMIQYGEENEPDYRHAWIDVFVDPRLRGRGVGTDAVATMIRYLVEERRHHRITIDPALDNAPAIRSYEKAGFRRVGVMESAWRGPDGRWRDVLLMEFVTPV